MAVPLTLLTSVSCCTPCPWAMLTSCQLMTSVSLVAWFNRCPARWSLTHAILCSGGQLGAPELDETPHALEEKCRQLTQLVSKADELHHTLATLALTPQLALCFRWKLPST